MKVRVALWIAIFFAAVGAGLVVLAIVLWGSDASLPVLFPGLAALGIGLAYLGPLPYLAVTETWVMVPMQIFGRRIPLGPRDRVDTGRGKLVIGQLGRPPRTIAYRGLARHADWDAMVTMLAGRGRETQRRRPRAAP